VVRHDQRVVALAESSLKHQGQRVARFCKLVVDPACRRRGIATALLDNLLKIDQRDSNPAFQCLIPSSWQTGLKFVEAFGFAHIESEFGMACRQLMAVPITVPSSVVLERVANPATHAADVARIHNAAYRNDAAFRPFTTEEMAHALSGDELWIARDGSRAHAFCHLQFEPDLVWLESIAVEPDSQDRGLGTALVYRALREANLSAERPAMLNVSSKNPRAISVYERLGFARRREMLRFSARRNDLAAAVARRKDRSTIP
jgi:ribosomal protein S18 acetylase RimI-like enzyme